MSNLQKKEYDVIKTRFLEMADEKTFIKEISFAMQLFNANSYLNKASKESKLQAVSNLALTGLTLNPVLKLAYLIPRYQNGGVQCCVEPSYQGLVKLVTDTGSAKTVYSHVVNEGDEFEVLLGTRTEIIHKPRFTSKTVTHVYAVAVLDDGSTQVEIMTLDQIHDIRAMSESYKAFKAKKTKSCVWEDHYGEMAKKTVIKRLVKYLPKTDKWDKLGSIIEIGNQDYKASINQVSQIESLLRTSLVPHDERDDIERSLSYITGQAAVDMISFLKENQVDPISAGNNYDQKDITKKIG